MIKIEINTAEDFANVEFDGDLDVIGEELLTLNAVAFYAFEKMLKKWELPQDHIKNIINAIVDDIDEIIKTQRKI